MLAIVADDDIWSRGIEMNSEWTIDGRVVAVHLSANHEFSKTSRSTIDLIAGVGVEGDAHAGVTIRHRSRMAKDPLAPNLRQIHLLANETLSDLRAKGFDVRPGSLGENITTQGVDLESLLEGTRLVFDHGCVVELTGLRNPCHQIENFRPGLLAEMRVVTDDDIRRRAGVMGIVLNGGRLESGANFHVVAPPAGASHLVVV